MKPGLSGRMVSASVTRPDNTTAYAAGDVINAATAANLEFSAVSEDKGDVFAVLSASLRVDVAAVPAGCTGFRLHLYNAAPTAIADNAAYNLPSGDRAKYLGYITFPAPIDLGATIWSQDDGINFVRKLASDSAKLYGMLETIGAYTPSSQDVFTVTLDIAGV